MVLNNLTLKPTTANLSWASVLRMAIICLLLGCYSFPLFSQTPEELKEKLRTAENDSVAIYALQKLCQVYGESQLDSALHYCKLARELAEEKGTPAEQARSLWKTASVNGRMGNHDRELALTLEALSILETAGDSSQLAGAYMQVGNAHYRVDNTELAAQNYRVSLAYAEAQHNDKRAAGTLNNLGNIYLDKVALDSAQYYFEKAREVNLRTDNQRWLAVNLYNLGRVEIHRENYPEALRYFEEGMTIRKQINSLSGQAAMHKMMGIAYTRWGKYAKAESHLQTAEEMYRESSGTPGLKDIKRAKSDLYAAKGQYQKALTFFKGYVMLRDSIQSIDLQNKMAYSQVAYEFERDERDRLLNQKELELKRQKQLNRTNRWLYISIGAGFALFGFGFVFFKRAQDQQKANVLLEDLVAVRTQELKQANSELSQFIYKSSHDIRGPISSIRGLVQVADKAEAEGDLRTYLSMIDQKADQLEKILRRLIETIGLTDKQLTETDLSLHTIADSTWQELSQEPGFQGITFHNELPEDLQITSDAHLVKVILVNLFQNAIWFRGTNQNSTCRIAAEQRDGHLHISISDNGSGVPVESQEKVWDMFYSAHANSPGSGLGLFIVKKAVNRLSGQVSLTSEVAKGTTVSIQLPAS